jgi:hypothetical protein
MTTITTFGVTRRFRRVAVLIALLIPTPLLAVDSGVTFLVTSDSHYDAFENEDRNERDRVTIDQMNQIASVAWPDELGGGLIGQPQGVLLLGDVIDDGDRMMQGKNQSKQQNRYFLADFGLDGTDGRLKYPVFEGWGNHDGPPEGRERFGFSFQKQLKQRNAQRLQRGLIDHVSENGFFVVQITADRIRLGYRAKMNVQVIRQPDRTERREWDGTWGWRFLHSRELKQ